MKKICSLFESLERGLFGQIIERVAFISCKDLINFRLSCKLFNERGHQRWFIETPAYDNYSNFESFMKLCVECGNNEALYKTGVKNYFINRNTEEALQMLEKASKGGHTAARYAFGLILIFLGGESRLDGIQTIGEMKLMQERRKITRQCRRRLREILRNICIFNIVLPMYPHLVALV
ncbi:hypothetical protein H5410_005051 [Solanum commersonii]|uniref:At2g35280-like TPR domain-containing protein n=1 Tax=Solanum commersonii TaxID=4109 RepID=A0A9J6A5L4_SOLCO|nr:hypothetical protein H5410_005051 [Solanum commersonii]